MNTRSCAGLSNICLGREPFRNWITNRFNAPTPPWCINTMEWFSSWLEILGRPLKCRNALFLMQNVGMYLWCICYVRNRKEFHHHKFDNFPLIGHPEMFYLSYIWQQIANKMYFLVTFNVMDCPQKLVSSCSQLLVLVKNSLSWRCRKTTTLPLTLETPSAKC